MRNDKVNSNKKNRESLKLKYEKVKNVPKFLENDELFKSDYNIIVS